MDRERNINRGIGQLLTSSTFAELAAEKSCDFSPCSRPSPAFVQSHRADEQGRSAGSGIRAD